MHSPAPSRSRAAESCTIPCCSWSMFLAKASNSSTVSALEGVISNSVMRFLKVPSPTCTTLTTSALDRSCPWMCAAMKSAAPQTPLGRRPVCIQSRFIDATRRREVLATACMARWSPNSRRSAKRWMYRLGSMGRWRMGCCSSRRRRQSWRKTAPRTYTLVWRVSEKSMSMYGLPSCRHTMYRHAPATCWVRRPRVKLRCTARRYRRCAALVMSSRGRMARRSATWAISYFPLLIVFSWESTWYPKKRVPLGPLESPCMGPESGTKFPSTWDAPPWVLENVGSVEKTLSSSTRPHVVQHEKPLDSS
mmetsp:Transcript_9958/g.32278  ORF Transcript_9958/g.32278 Transcript_9958/m.32278 type:complete len:306 (-) Transcript_9958:94-1011(-)